MAGGGGIHVRNLHTLCQPWAHLRAAMPAAVLMLGAEAAGQVGLCQVEYKLLASDGNAGAGFGSSVSVSGDPGNEVAVVGVPFRSSAYIYRFNGSSWIEEQKLTASDGEFADRFGWSVSISGAPGNEVVVIGANEDDDNGSDSGSAYIYRFDGSSWIEEQKLVADDGAADDLFGFSVSVGGAPGNEVAVIGAYQDDDNGSLSGSAYVYRWGGSSWAQEQKLTAADGAAFDTFGYSVSVGGAPGSEVAVVGALTDDDLGFSSGSAYIYRWGGTSWVQEQKLLPSDGDSADHFGNSVSVGGAAGGEVAVVGAYWDNDFGGDSGSAYVFRFNPGLAGWFQEQKLTAADGAASDEFGISVSVNGDTAMVGAHRDSDLGSSSGSAYTFVLRLNRINADCNSNGTADVFDLLDGAAADCNDNLVPDSCDIAGGFSLDGNVNGIPDECEVAPACPADISGDGLVNVTDLLALLAAWGACP